MHMIKSSGYVIFCKQFHQKKSIMLKYPKISFPYDGGPWYSTSSKIAWWLSICLALKIIFHFVKQPNWLTRKKRKFAKWRASNEKWRNFFFNYSDVRPFFCCLMATIFSKDSGLIFFYYQLLYCNCPLIDGMYLSKRILFYFQVIARLFDQRIRVLLS